MPLEAYDIHHRYRRGPDVLRGISLSIEEGVSLAVTGASGAGKSTLLAILGLLMTPIKGDLVLDGASLRLSERSRGQVRSESIAWIFQTTNALGRRTALDNVALGLMSRGERRADARRAARRALSDVGLEGMELRRVYTLSIGELQRVGIARAMISRPRFVFADEPTGHLDADTTQATMTALLRVKPTNTAVVVATHDPGVVRMCDMVFDLVNGRLRPA